MKSNIFTSCRTYIFIIALFSSCAGESEKFNNSSVEQIIIGDALNNIREDIRLSDIAEEVRYIKLETGNEFLIDKIAKIIIEQNKVFLCDKTQMFEFDINGKFVRKFGASGKGPGEFVKINDFAINSKEGLLTIYDNELQKIIHFDFDGSLNNEFHLPNYPQLISYDQNGQMYVSWVFPEFFLNENYRINIYKSNGDLLNRLIKTENDKLTAENIKSIPSTSRTRLEYFNDTLSYWEVNLPIIYRVDQNKAVARYEIIPDVELDFEELNSNKIDAERFIISTLLETSRYIFLPGGVYQNDILHIMYDKQNTAEPICGLKTTSSSIETRLKSGFINDLDGGYPLIPQGVLSKDEVYCTFFAYNAQEILSESPFSDVQAESEAAKNAFSDLLDNSTIEDNPIIMIAKLKGL